MVRLAIYKPTLEELEVTSEPKLASCSSEQAAPPESTGILSPGLQAFRRCRQHSDMLLKRARIIARNKRCPDCRSVKITLWDDELKPREQSGQALNILFHCECCHTSWRD